MPIAVEEPPRLALLGIITAPDGARTAVIMDEADHTSLSLRAGDDRRGWGVRSIDRGGVTLAKQDRTIRLTFQRAEAPKTLPAN